MSKTPARYYLEKMKRHYRWLRIGESVVWSVAVVVIILSTGLYSELQTSILLLIALSLGLVTFLVRSFHLKLFSLTDDRLVQFMNQHYPQLEESADLLVKNDDVLSSLQLLQKQRATEKFEQLYGSVKLPSNLVQASLSLLIAIGVYIGLSSFTERSVLDVASTEALAVSDLIDKAILPAAIEKVTLTITPPGYTKLARVNTDNMNVVLPEGSHARWLIAFSEEVNDPFLLFSGNKQLAMLPQQDGKYYAEDHFSQSGFYQVGWREGDSVQRFSAYYKIEVIRDHAPVIVVENQDQFVALSMTDKQIVDVRAELSDDYGLKDAYIIATVSKGSGESVKFREEKLPFTVSGELSGRKINVSRSIDLLKLGLEPGDEVYYYIEAIDTKVPIPNRSRTETYFVALQDTASITSFTDAGLGVDLMPDYFRSQRQIIIDSEKLLAGKNKISKQEFSSRSNELGYDQKVLRLRYGEFLGEEFESGIGINQETGSEPDDHDHDDDEDVVKKYSHVHDSENEHNLVPGKGMPVHNHGDDDPEKTKNPLDAFLHAHDSEEEATFFVKSIKIKLKAAITIMWDAELYLRLYQPEKSLPYQYQALKLLKEISQDSRIYVHRVGFEPPPLKEEKRLTGDLKDVRSSRHQQSIPKEEDFPAIRKLLPVIERIKESGVFQRSPETRTLLVNAGQEVGEVALKDSRYIESLSQLKILLENDLTVDERKTIAGNLQRIFWDILPKMEYSPSSISGKIHSLDQQFLNNLNELKNQ